jgi:peptidoglycan/xylan/chitin deacetylase (PgdA/CDA1 family)
MSSAIRRWPTQQARRATAAAGRRFLGTLTRVKTAEPLVALTFDDGPHPLYTPALLDVLARYGARATFFVIGEQVAAHPELARRIVAEGHALANHTWSHRDLPDLTRAERHREIRRCAVALAPYGDARLFRPPHGRLDLASRLDLALAGHLPVTWSAHAEDWRHHDATTFAERLRARVRPGSITLLHDAITGPGLEPGVHDRTPLIEAVARFLAESVGRLRAVTVAELMRTGTPVYTNWYQY